MSSQCSWNVKKFTVATEKWSLRVWHKMRSEKKVERGHNWCECQCRRLPCPPRALYRLVQGHSHTLLSRTARLAFELMPCPTLGVWGVDGLQPGHYSKGPLPLQSSLLDSCWGSRWTHFSAHLLPRLALQGSPESSPSTNHSHKSPPLKLCFEGTCPKMVSLWVEGYLDMKKDRCNFQSLSFLLIQF